MLGCRGLFRDVDIRENDIFSGNSGISRLLEKVKIAVLGPKTGLLKLPFAQNDRPDLKINIPRPKISKIAQKNTPNFDQNFHICIYVYMYMYICI